MQAFTLDHVSPTDFEQFVYELLRSLGFQAINWRKGSNTGASVSDQGRDLEASLIRTDIDGAPLSERWFVECKHRKDAVPPNELQNLLIWAQAERPDRALIVCSGFLSNAAKNYLELYRTNNLPPFRLTAWERPDLERLCSGKLALLARFSLSASLPHLNLLHPLHAYFLKSPPFVDLKALFGTLDTLCANIDESQEPVRKDLLGFLPMEVIKPRFRKPVTGRETLAELCIDDLSYKALKDKCFALATQVDDTFLTVSILGRILQWLFMMGDTTAVDEVIERNRSALEHFREERSKRGDNGSSLDKLIASTERHIAELPERTRNMNALYNEFCEKVLCRLYMIEPLGRSRLGEKEP